MEHTYICLNCWCVKHINLKCWTFLLFYLLFVIRCEACDHCRLGALACNTPVIRTQPRAICLFSFFQFVFFSKNICLFPTTKKSSLVHQQWAKLRFNKHIFLFPTTKKKLADSPKTNKMFCFQPQKKLDWCTKKQKKKR